MEGQFVVLDKEEKVVAIVSDSEVIINDEYQVIYDPKEEYQFVDCGNGMVRAVKEKTPQDVLNQGEWKKVSYPCFDVLEIPISELINRKGEILDFLIKPVVDGHLIKNAECIRENQKYIFTIFYECRWLLKQVRDSGCNQC